MKKIVISSGGSAGHINPALSIAKALAEKNWEIHYIGNINSMEEYLLSKTEYRFYGIDVQKIYRRLTFEHLKFPLKLIKSIVKSCSYLKTIKPVVFLGCGGFVSGPPAYAAHLLKIPLILQEQNSFPGLTTRILSPRAKIVFLGNKKAENYLKAKSVQYTGNPVNKEFASLPGETTAKTIFLLGGSQGSLALNNIMLKSYSYLLKSGYKVIWQTGKNHYKSIKSKIGNPDNLILFDYTTQIHDYFAETEIVIARAGAITIAELETLKLPAILVPLPSAAENHQYYNALEQQEKGIGIVIEQKDLTPELLLKQVDFMQENIADFKSKFKDSMHLHAAELIAEYIDKNFGG